jgi:hypothetical protein
MTCAGISSLIVSGHNRSDDEEILLPDGAAKDRGRGAISFRLQRGIQWMAAHSRIGENYGSGQAWMYYYLRGLERAARLSGQRLIGKRDWYGEEAAELVGLRKANGSWAGTAIERDPLIATSFALLFLSKGGAPVLISKLRHGPGGDWNNDPIDVGNLVEVIGRDLGRLLLWRSVEPDSATVEVLLEAPIIFLNGHEAPTLDAAAREALRGSVERGGTILAEACCGRRAFDEGFRGFIKEVFPGPEHALRLLPPDHAVWTSKHRLSSDAHPLWGLDQGGRTTVLYSPSDLSCGWNLAAAAPNSPHVIKTLRVGQNIVSYTLGRGWPGPPGVIPAAPARPGSDADVTPPPSR